MSPQYAAFRRQPAPQQLEQQLRTITMPAPMRGLIQNENEAYMQPGGTLVHDNWFPTMQGVKLRGGFVKYCDIHSIDTPPVTRLPIISAFEYAAGTVARMFAGQATKLFDVTTTTPTLVKSGQTSGNYAAAQFANAGSNWMLVCNDAGDYVLRYNGSTWVTLDASGIAVWSNGTAYTVGTKVMDGADSSIWTCAVANTSAASGSFSADRAAHPTFWTTGQASDNAAFISGPVGTPVVAGHNLCYVWKYRNRLFFIELSSMNAWYLPINAVGGPLSLVPLAGSAAKGGKLMFGASWSMDAGDGLDEKCIFVTDLGEVLIFTGTNPADAANWRQQGRYNVSPPLGMNGHIQIGGDMMILTVDGIVPLSQAIARDPGQLELAMLTRTIKSTWREDVLAKRGSPWSVKKWDEYGGIFVAMPGGTAIAQPGVPGNSKHCLVANNATNAWARFTYDAQCFIRMRGDMFFGNQDGIVMQCERTGYDDGAAYLATLVGGWETFGVQANQVVWHQARATFRSGIGEPFQPQLAATVNYVVNIPPPPAPGVDPGTLDVWDQGLWGPDQPWANNKAYVVGDLAFEVGGIGPVWLWRCTVAHTSAAAGTFAADRAGAASGKWVSAAPPSAPEVAAWAQWDQPSQIVPPVRNTMWVSIGQTGYSHAPIVQVQIAQQATPSVELIAISATYEPAGVNV